MTCVVYQPIASILLIFHIYLCKYNLLNILVKINVASYSLINAISKLSIAIMDPSPPSHHLRGAIETTMGSIKAIN